jgi:hypothetical protein
MTAFVVDFQQPNRITFSHQPYTFHDACCYISDGRYPMESDSRLSKLTIASSNGSDLLDDWAVALLLLKIDKGLLETTENSV